MLTSKEAKAWFKASMGHRKGDSLSPFLFTLVVVIDKEFLKEGAQLSRKLVIDEIK